MAEPISIAITVFTQTLKVAKALVPKRTFSVAPKLTYVDPRFNNLLLKYEYYRYQNGTAGTTWREINLHMSMTAAMYSYDEQKASDALLMAMVDYYTSDYGQYPYNPVEWAYGGYGYSYLDVWNALEGNKMAGASLIAPAVDAITNKEDLQKPVDSVGAGTDTGGSTIIDPISGGGGGDASGATDVKKGFPWGKVIIGAGIGTIGGPAGMAIGGILGFAADKVKKS